MNKDYEFEQDESGTIHRIVPMSDDLSDLVDKRMVELSKELGRELNPNDKLFLGHFEQIEHQMVEAMRAAGVSPAIIFAFEETGLLVSEENQHLINDEDLRRWKTAIDDYYATEPTSGVKFPLGTVVKYGPDDNVTTKLVAAVLTSPDSEPVMERFVGSNIDNDPVVRAKINAFFAFHNVADVVRTEKNLGCPHEEGPDFPIGEDCPFCPFWKGKQGSAAVYDNDDDDDEVDLDPTFIAEMLKSLGPEAASEMLELALSSENAEDFADAIMVGPCPTCDSDNTNDCDEDPMVDNIIVGRCHDCGCLWCLFCDEIFTNEQLAAGHDCLDDLVDEEPEM